MKKKLIINGHPDIESLCTALAEQYKIGADLSGADCKLINLTELDFSPVLKYGYRKRTDFEPDTFFPKIDTSIWKEVDNVFHKKDKKHDYEFSFITYKKNFLPLIIQTLH